MTRTRNDDLDDTRASNSSNSPGREKGALRDDGDVDFNAAVENFAELLAILREWDEAEHMKNKLVNEGIPAAPLAESAEHP